MSPEPKHTVNELRLRLHLFRPKCLDRFQLRRFASWIISKEHADCSGEADRKQHRFKTQKYWPSCKLCHSERRTRSETYTDETAERAQRHSFRQKLIANIPATRTDCQSQPDFSRPLRH